MFANPLILLEAATGFEPVYNGFAECPDILCGVFPCYLVFYLPFVFGTLR